MIVGNKSDLKSEQRHVPTEEGRQMAEEFKCGFTEASARLDINVSKAFEQMVTEVEKSQNPAEPTGAHANNSPTGLLASVFDVGEWI
ncbi:MAG: hypothetical protein Q9213_000037 [Squamulea squamosa]